MAGTPGAWDGDAGRAYLRERLAALVHEQWTEWSRALAAGERLSPARLARWRAGWVPYAALTEAGKDRDRAYADRILALLADPDPPREVGAPHPDGATPRRRGRGAAEAVTPTPPPPPRPAGE